jgi:hypothetical protein
MTIKEFFSMLWNKIRNLFLSFVKDAVGELTQKLVVELKDFAVQTVATLENSDLTDVAKRKAAFTQIVSEAKARGLVYSDSAINFLIELAVQKLKSELGE